MKKKTYYIIALCVAAVLLLLFFTWSNKKNLQMDQRITLRRQDKIPYGTYIAFENLQYLFPEAHVYASRQEPGYWDSLSMYDTDQAFIAVTGRLEASSYEIKKLISFAEKGNDVFISTQSVSYAVEEILQCSTIDNNESFYFDDDNKSIRRTEDSLRLVLNNPPFAKDSALAYPGRKYSAVFTKLNNTITEELGQGGSGKPNFIHLQAGKGNFYLHLAPLAFSNYFLLHKNNIRYYEKALSVINPHTTKIVWDEYYLNKRKENDEKKGWFSVLMNMKNSEGKKPFSAAFWLLIMLLLLYALSEMRRKQRYIPVIPKLRNDSLDFVKTIGRLYYDKGDHKNLCRKMSTYFLEHIRIKYKLLTGRLDDEFIKNLHYKSGMAEEEIRGIVSFISYAEETPSINQKQLLEFYKRLEYFYQKT